MARGSMDEERRLMHALARREKAAWAEVYDDQVRDLYGFIHPLSDGDFAARRSPTRYSGRPNASQWAGRSDPMMLV